MPFHTREGRRYLSFDLLDGQNITHAIFTRHGGISPDPWASLNVGGGIGDDSERVIRNRFLSFDTLGRPRNSIFDVWQVHSTDVVIADRPRDMTKPYIKADAILTNNPQVTLFMRFADCVPILLYDPIRRVVGLVHAGWQGTVKGAVREAVKAMQAHYGTCSEDILAVIGPSIGKDHYEVGTDVVDRVRETFGGKSGSLLTSPNGKKEHFDLWAANRIILEEMGVYHVETAGLCTACHLNDWYSHRAEHGRTGRFGALIALNE